MTINDLTLTIDAYDCIVIYDNFLQQYIQITSCEVVDLIKALRELGDELKQIN